MTKVSAVLLCMWILAPLVAIIINLFSKSPAKLEYTAFMSEQNALYIILLQMGFFGCFAGLAVFMKSIYSAKRQLCVSKTMFKKYCLNTTVSDAIVEYSSMFCIRRLQQIVL